MHGSHVVEGLVQMLDKNSTERSSEFGLERERGPLNRATMKAGIFAAGFYV